MAESVLKQISWPEWRNCTNSTKWQNYSLKDDIKQQTAIGKELINIILYSRRLLGEHVDALEEWLMSITKVSDDLYEIQNNYYSMEDILTLEQESEMKEDSQTPYEILTWKNGCSLLGCSLLECLIRSRFYSKSLYTSLLFTGSFGVLYMVKQIFRIRNRMATKELHCLISTIAEFSNCMNRNMAYFDAILNMKQKELLVSKHINRVWDCITAATIVTEILFDATRNLEEDYPLPAHYSQYYEPMEDIRKSKYFNEPVCMYTSKHIKDFHNIYIYVQSQYLLRLAFTISQRPSLSQLNREIAKLRSLIERWVIEEENHFKNLTIEERKKSSVNINLVAKNGKYRPLSLKRINPIEMMQDTSMKLNARMIIVANQCYNLDSTLRQMINNEAKKSDNTNTFLNVSNHMNNIESTLTLCYEDFQHLMLVYNKYLNSQKGFNLSGTVENGESLSLVRSNEEDLTESILRVEISQNSSENNGPQQDDFYAYMYDQNRELMTDQDDLQPHQQSQPNKSTPERDLLNFEKRISKRRFEPVLKQLKDRIDPIREKMLEKEREILAAKGIDIKEFIDNTTKDDCHSQSSDKYLLRETNIVTDDGDSESGGTCESNNESDYQKPLGSDYTRPRRFKKNRMRDNYSEMRKFLAKKDNCLLPFQLPTTHVNHLGKEEIVESNC